MVIITRSTNTHPAFMPNARKKDTSLAGAYIPSEQDFALAKLALKKGYPDKASFIRALYDAVLNEDLAALDELASQAPRDPQSDGDSQNHNGHSPASSVGRRRR
jgi:hypothetical protein